MRRITSFIITAILAWQPIAYANNNHDIQSLIEHILPDTNIGISITDAKTGDTIYQHNAFSTFMPASNAKIFSGAAALIKLGPNYRYQTTVHINNKKLHEGVLNDDIVITFVGDPALKVAHLNQLVASIKKKGIHKIIGDVIINNSRFTQPYYAPGWSVDDIIWGYAAPISSIIIEENQIPVNITPNKTLNQKALISLAESPLKPYLRLQNNLTTVTKTAAEEQCSFDVNTLYENLLQLNGCWPMTEKSSYVKFAIQHPDAIAKKVLAQLFNNHHIQVTGSYITSSIAKKPNLIAKHDSPPMLSLVKHMMKYSNNIYAESFTKTLGYEAFGEGSFKQGVRAIKAILYAKTNIDFSSIQLVDGSGMSRYNLITPRSITRLLYVLRHDQSLNKLFYPTLADAGVDGTLRGKFTSFDLKNKIHAKTGTIHNVTALSGYLDNPNNNQLVFSILINQMLHDSSSATAFISALSELFTSGAISNTRTT